MVLLTRPTLAIYLLCFSVPYESLRPIDLGGLNATTTEFIAFCGGVAYLVQGVRYRQVTARWAWWRGPLIFFALVMLASVTQASDVKLSIKELLKLGEMLLTYLLVLAYIDTPAKLRRLLFVVVLAACSEALLGVLQAGAHFGPASFARGVLLRGSGTFDQPNPFAGYLNLTLPLLFAGVVLGVPLAGRLTRPALLLLSAAVLLSVSRGALLATIAAVAVMLIIVRPRFRALVGLVGVVGFALVGGTIIGVLPAAISDKIAVTLGLDNVDVVNPTPITWAVAERLAHMIAGINMFLAHPVLGVGIGNYAAVYGTYKVRTTTDVWGPALGHAHNYYINVAAEAGVFGFVAFLVVLISGLRIAVRLYRMAADPLARALALGTLGVLVTVAVHSFFDDIFVHAMEAQVALVVGMATVSGRLAQQAEETAPANVLKGA